MIAEFLQRPSVAATAGVVLVLGAGGALTKIGPWYERLRKPSWQPPGWVFAPVWTTIGALTVASVAKAWPAITRDHAAPEMLTLFAINAVTNIAWSGLFFSAQRPDWALIEVTGLFASVAALAIGMARHDPGSALLLLPYLIWVGIAAYLNLTIVRLNRPFGADATAA